MKAPLVLAGLLVLTAGCGSTTAVATHVGPSAGVTASPGAPSTTPSAAASPSASPSSSASPSPPPVPAAAYAVIVKNFLAEGGATYTLSIVALDGHTVVAVTPRKRSVPNVQVGNLSASATTLYYLDGDSDVRFIRPDGTKGLATTIAVSGKQAAAFAVSPDDSRIAVSILDYKSYPVSTRLYVEDLHGGGNHIELFSSATALEWPVGWHSGHLVLAVGLDIPPQNVGDFFELPQAGYHVADAQSGKRLVDLCANSDSLYAPSQAGAVCENHTTYKVQVASWDGAVRAIPNAPKPEPGFGDCPLSGPVSPAGVIATNMTSISLGGCQGGDSVYLLDASGHLGTTSVASQAFPIGWIDARHLVVGTYSVLSAPPLSVVDVQTGKAAKIQATGFLAAVLPGSL